MEAIMAILAPHIVEVVSGLILLLVGYISTKTKAYFDFKKMEDIVAKTVNYVEELGYRGEIETGIEKFERAKEIAVGWLNDKGIKYTEAELDILIDSAVNIMRGE